MPRSSLAMLFLALVLSFSLGGVARAEGPEAPPRDEARLAAGQTVSYPQTLYRHGKRYVGGVTYAVVDASVAELTGLLSDMSAFTAVLPHAMDARLVGSVGDDRLVQITQGISFLQAAYTIQMRVDDDHRRVRFWLDHQRPHAIDDAWGYFRVDPLPSAASGSPRVLLTYGILVDLGPGLIRDLFEARIQASMLNVPDRLKRYTFARFRRHAARRDGAEVTGRAAPSADFTKSATSL
jgi:hypothetical protein